MKAVLAVLVLAACVQKHDRSPPPVEAVPVAPVAVPAPPAALEPSIYDLDLRLRTSDDVEVGIDTQRGHPVLITMFYASCPVACPVLIEDVGRIAAQLPLEVQRDLRFVIVSFDSRDTPAVLRELAEKRHLDERWTVATANDADARTLAATLGFKFRQLANGEYLHGATVVALDAEGRPIARSEQIRRREAIVSALR